MFRLEKSYIFIGKDLKNIKQYEEENKSYYLFCYLEINFFDIQDYFFQIGLKEKEIK